MAKRTPDVRALLQEGSFGPHRDGHLPPADPVAPTPMILPVEAIRPYDRNPRRRPNPKYEDIHRSIKAKPGLADDPLTVTRRPGDEHLIVKAGGNTRLEIHRTLWQDTGDPVYRDVFCLFVPWESESEVLRAHIVENEARGELNFIDLAHAVMDLKRQIETETGDTLNRGQFQRRLGCLGYVISRRQLIRYEFATEVLEPLIPKAFATGLGGWRVDLIRDLHRAYRRYHEQLAGAPPFEALFAEALAQHDGELLDLEEVRADLDARFSRYGGLPANRVHLAVEALLYDGRHQADTDPTPDPPPSPTVPHGSTDGDGVLEREEAGLASADLEPSLPYQPTTPAEKHEAPSPGSPRNDTPVRSGQDLAIRLATARARCREEARRFAAALGLEVLIVDNDEGFGFCIDLPAGPLPADPCLRAAWWCLLGLSEIAVSPYRLQLAPPGLALQPVLLEDRAAELHALVGAPPAVPELAFRFLSSERLPEAAYGALIELVGCCRRMRRHFPETDLWHAPTVDSNPRIERP